jgi:hypothetical protein
MSRTESRHNPHVQGARPPAASRPTAAPEEAPAEAEANAAPVSHAGWRLAVFAWAIMFLFLSALAVFDMITGLFKR